MIMVDLRSFADLGSLLSTCYYTKSSKALSSRLSRVMEGSFDTLDKELSGLHFGDEKVEDILQSLLSLRASSTEDDSLTEVAISCLVNDEENAGTNNIDILFRNLLYRIQSLMTPSEFHTCIVHSANSFTDDDDTPVAFCIVCLIALCKNLKRFDKGQKRMKRWLSMIWETIAFFQRHFENSENVSTIGAVLWTKHVFPSSDDLLNVLIELDCALVFARAPFVAVTIATVSEMAYNIVCQEGLSAADILMDSLNPFAESELQSIFLFPEYAHSQDPEDRTTIRYWCVGEDEEKFDRIANARSTWEAVPIAIISSLCFQRGLCPHSWSPTTCWKCWFPHVGELLHHSADETDSLHTIHAIGFRLLEQLLPCIPSKSLGLPLPFVPSHPSGTIQLLSNRMIVASRPSEIEPAVSSTKAFNLIKELVSKYFELDQSILAGHLIEECPYPALVPKFVDLLRSFVQWADRDAIGQVFELIDRELGTLKGMVVDGQVESLVLASERYVAVVGLLQIWCMVRKDSLSFSRRQLIGEIADGIRRSEHSRVPDVHRLFLLESAIVNVCSL